MCKEKKAELKVNPIVAKLLKADGQDSIVEIEGYVGSVEEGTVRLYKNLGLSEYVEVPEDSILHTINIPDDKGGRVKVYIEASTEVVSVSIRRLTTRAGDLEEQVMDTDGVRMGLVFFQRRPRTGGGFESYQVIKLIDDYGTVGWRFVEGATQGPIV